MASDETPASATLETALQIVSKTEGIRVPDRQTCIEAASMAVLYRANTDTNFQDRTAFVTGVARYTEEATVHADLNLLLEQGQDFCAMLYTWRCCSYGFPQVKSSQQENRMDIYNTIIEILEPKISKLCDFMRFQKTAIDRFCNEVKRLCHKEKKNDFVSEAYLLTLGKFINMFAVLDELKNMKSSISNDLSAYRRAMKCVNVLADINSLQESDNLSMFLATQNVIKDSIKATLLTIKGFEDLLSDVINICVCMYENKMYNGPSEKHMLVKVMAFGLFIIDHGETSINELDNRGKLCISKIDKILKQLEVVSLYGDMQVMPFQYIKNSKHFNPSKWPRCGDDHISPQSSILTLIEPARTEQQAYISKLAMYRQKHMKSNDSKPSVEEDDEVYEMALKGIGLLSLWTQHVVELYSWKLTHPTNPEKNTECPPEAEEYERATRYNYTSDEKFAVVELIAMTKELQRLMLQMECTFMDGVRRHIYREIQVLAQQSLQKILKRKAKSVILVIIKSVIDTCADWLDGEPNEGTGTKRRKESKKVQTEMSLRNVGPSSTQLYMVRTMLESLIGDKCAAGNKPLKKLLETKEIDTIATFHRNSFYWSYMLNFNESVQQCCDLSQLWYKEFYLEMTMGRRIQFPIEMSMPWILTSHILDAEDPFMIQYLLYPLDLYNDSAVYSLTFFKQQFLYDETEAEIDLCFDQFVFKLSQQIVLFYKQLATRILLKKNFSYKLRGSGEPGNVGMKNGYECLLQQRHVQLLGRTVDLNHLIRQRVDIAFIESLDVAISVFESGDMTDVVELQEMIGSNRLAHRLLRKHLALNDFDDMFREANHSTASPYGRIMLHLFWCLYKDFLPHFCFNTSTSRFVRTQRKSSEKHQRDAPTHVSHPYAWGTQAPLLSKFYQIFSGFVGAPHFDAISRLLGYDNVAVLIDGLLKVLAENLKGPLRTSVQDVVQNLPERCNLLSYGYGSPGILRYFLVQLSSIINSERLKALVLQRLREIGNGALFCLKLENAMRTEEAMGIFQKAPFLKLIPKPFIPESDQTDPDQAEERLLLLMQQLEHTHRAHHATQIITEYGNDRQSEVVQEGEALTKEQWCRNHSIFGKTLESIRQFLDDPIWHGAPPNNGVISIHESVEFHRVWSVIQFVSNLPPLPEDEFTDEELYGDSPQWAGCIIIALLGQQKRFEALDLSRHLVKVHDLDECDEKVDHVDLKHFIERAEESSNLSTAVFNLLNTYTSIRTNAESGDTSCVTHLQPPSFE